MTFLEKIKSPGFWTNVFKIALPFFIIVTIFSLFMNSWREVFAGDFDKVNVANFSEGKWQRFWGIKIIISFGYAMYVALKKTK
jgi:hypothetical protein